MSSTEAATRTPSSVSNKSSNNNNNSNNILPQALITPSTIQAATTTQNTELITTSKIIPVNASVSQTSIHSLNRLSRTDKLQKTDFLNIKTLKNKLSSSPQTMKRVASTSNLTYSDNFRKTLDVDLKGYSELYQMPLIEKPGTSQRVNSLKKSYVRQGSRLKMDDLQFNKLNLNSNNTLKNNQFYNNNQSKHMDNAKLKQKQRNQIYALNSLMTSIEYDNFLQFCSQHNIKLK